MELWTRISRKRSAGLSGAVSAAPRFNLAGVFLPPTHPGTHSHISTDNARLGDVK